MLKKIFPYLLIFLTVLVLFITNYRPGAWLSGWDNLHPEFNFKLNLQREIYSGWQEYQGLGAVGGLMIATDIPRLIFLWLMSFFLPLSALRYVFTFLMLLLGGIGMKKLLKFIGNDITSLSGALFYILNLGTVQIFYAPFDPFVVFFGFLPWLVYAFINTLNNPNKKNLIIFSIINFLAVPQNYVPTMFVVYLIALALISVGYYFKNKTKQSLKSILALFSLIFLINSFWLLNFFYFIKTNINSPAKSHMGYMSTDNIYLQNKKYGDLGDVIKLKGFLFDYADSDSSGKFVYMMTPWKNYVEKWPTEIILIGEFLIVILGIIYLYKKKNKYWLSFFLLFIFSFIILANDTPIISLANDFLRSLPFFSQVFRVPFTKFANLTVFSYSIFFSFGVTYLSDQSRKLNLQKIIVPLSIILIISTTLPAFSGNLIYEKLKVNIPQEYFDLMNYFDSQPMGRIALFPQTSYWNWNFYSWNYVGTGFLWYGIKQPTLDRAFDGYSKTSENYYLEISRALYSKDLTLFEKLLTKYQVNWLIIDNSIISNGSPKTLYNDQLRTLIGQSEKIKYLISFGNLEVYEVLSNPKNNYISLNSNLPTIGPKYNWSDYDKAFVDYGDYLNSNNTSELQVFYPFRSLFTGKKPEDKEFSIEEDSNFYIFKAQVPSEFNNLITPAIEDLEATEYDKNDLTKTRKVLPQTYFDDISRIFKVYVPKIRGFYSYNSKKDSDFYAPQAQTCNSFDSKEYSIQNDHNNIMLSSQDGSSCLILDFPNFTQKLGYLINIRAKNIEGKSLFFNLINKNSRRKDIDTNLSITNSFATNFYIQPLMENDGVGYSLILDNISIGNIITKNSIEEITVNPIPYKFLTSLKFTKNNNLVKPDEKILLPTFTHNDIWTYKVYISQIDDNSILYLSQSYSPGWIAFSNGKILDHVLVNNWANGWRLNNETMKQLNNGTITIIFWPQYLEFLGFGLLAIAFLIILFIKEN